MTDLNDVSSTNAPLDRDPVETTVTFDHDLKVVHGWTSNRTMAKYWLQDYPDHAKGHKGYVELKCSMDEFVPYKKLRRPVKRELSPKQLEVLRRLHHPKSTVETRE